MSHLNKSNEIVGYNQRMNFTVLPQHATLHRLFLMRFIAVTGQISVMGIAQHWLGIELPWIPVFAVVGFEIAFNAWTWWRMQDKRPVSDGALFGQLGVDILALSILLYFSGGATNPFVSFYLPALAVSAAILPWHFAVVLAVVSLASYSAMMNDYVPLTLRNEDHAVMYHLVGMWANFALSAVLIVWFVARMSKTVRERDAQLAQARELRLQGERIIALATQAASAAHEMGTPLATMAILAGELKNEANENAVLTPYSAEFQMFETQIAVCKTALERMNMDAYLKETASENPLENLTVHFITWLKETIETWRLMHPSIQIEHALDQLPDHAATYRISHCQVVGQILVTLLDNAAKANTRSNKKVYFSLTIETGKAIVRIRDEGDGIDPDIHKRLGYEPVRSQFGGKGIGLMLAFSSAQQIGVTIELLTRQSKNDANTLSEINSLTGTVAILSLPLL